MSQVAIRAALETKLDSILPAISTNWENTPFKPVNGTPYQQVYLLPGEPDNPTMGDGFYRDKGILQINLMYPQLTGTGTAAARAELIRTTFKRGTSIISGGITVIIEKTPEIGQGRPDGDRWFIPVRIRWFSDKII